MHSKSTYTTTPDYYPFGVVMSERSWSEGYRYGFNGKEKDDEGMGGGLSTYDYGFRIYNAALGKFLSVDPLTKDYPWYTPYQFAGNKPIWASDLDGKEDFQRTKYYDMAGNLYRTEIQVTTSLDGTWAQFEQMQVVHETRVDVINVNGDLNMAYIGSTVGNWISNAVLAGGSPFGSSTAFTQQENSLIWNTRVHVDPLTGAANPNLNDVTSPMQSQQNIVTTVATNPIGPNPAQLVGGPSPVSPGNGVVTINNGIAPLNEAFLPSGSIATPLSIHDRFNIANGDPLTNTPGATLDRCNLHSKTSLSGSNNKFDSKRCSMETVPDVTGAGFDTTMPRTYQTGSELAGGKDAKNKAVTVQ